MKIKSWPGLIMLLVVTASVNAGGWVEGTPAYIQKSDYSSLNLIYIHMETPVTYAGDQCDSNDGVVIHDDNPSADVALSFATTALVAKQTFRCFIHTNQCSRTTGTLTTYPVCELYPTLLSTE